MKSDTIQVSFKQTKDEQDLKNKILNASKLIGQSAWMKVAANEKLERDEKDTKETVKSDTDFNPFKL